MKQKLLQALCIGTLALIFILGVGGWAWLAGGDTMTIRRRQSRKDEDR